MGVYGQAGTSITGSPPGCRVKNSVALSHLTSNNWLSLTAFDTELFDNDNMHSLVTNTQRITFNTAGVYVVGGGFEFASNVTGLRGIRVYLNGTTPIAYMYYPAVTGGVGTGMCIETTYKFAATDFVELQGFQNGASPLAITGGIDQTPGFWAHWVGLGT
jgi:hypothetical protein